MVNRLKEKAKIQNGMVWYKMILRETHPRLSLVNTSLLSSV